MAEINTKYFGTMPFTDEEIIHFKDGLFGFEEYKQFLLIRFVNEASSMLCLQSIDDVALAFVVINPFYYMPDYAPCLSSADLASLQAESNENLVAYAICTMGKEMAESTANLKCPIVINLGHGNIAKQVILEDNDYTFKHFFALENLTKGGS